MNRWIYDEEEEEEEEEEDNGRSLNTIKNMKNLFSPSFIPRFDSSNAIARSAKSRGPNHLREEGMGGGGIFIFSAATSLWYLSQIRRDERQESLGRAKER